jgi:hypothetical protein
MERVVADAPGHKGSLTVAGMIRGTPAPLAPPVNSQLLEDKR